jgi:hypothetical protein
VPPGSRGHIDFGEQFPYDPEKAKVLLDPYIIARAIGTRAGNNTINHDDAHVDGLIDRMQEAGTEGASLEAAGALVKEYKHLDSFTSRFKTTRLDKP